MKHPNRDITDLDRRIGEKITQARLKRKLTISQLAKKLGIDRRQLYKYEASQNRVSAARLFFIAKALKVEYDYFMRDLPLAVSKKGKPVPKKFNTDTGNIVYTG